MSSLCVLRCGRAEVGGGYKSGDQWWQGPVSISIINLIKFLRYIYFTSFIIHLMIWSFICFYWWPLCVYIQTICRLIYQLAKWKSRQISYDICKFKMKNLFNNHSRQYCITIVKCLKAIWRFALSSTFKQFPLTRAVMKYKNSKRRLKRGRRED